MAPTEPRWKLFKCYYFIILYGSFTQCSVLFNVMQLINVVMLALH